MSLVFESTILMKKFIQKSFAFSFFKTGLQVKDFFKCSNSLRNNLITILWAELSVHLLVPKRFYRIEAPGF
jgi:hypothetical protein